MNVNEDKPVWTFVFRCGAMVIALGVLLTPTFPREIALLNSRAPKLVVWLDKHVGISLSNKSMTVPPPTTTFVQQQRIRQKLKSLPSYSISPS